MVAIGDLNTLYVVAIIILAIVAYSLWRNSKRHGRAVEGTAIGPAVDAALRSLLAGETRFIVVSVSARVYLQFAVEPNGGLLRRPIALQATRSPRRCSQRRGSAECPAN